MLKTVIRECETPRLSIMWLYRFPQHVAENSTSSWCRSELAYRLFNRRMMQVRCIYWNLSEMPPRTPEGFAWSWGENNFLMGKKCIFLHCIMIIPAINSSEKAADRCFNSKPWSWLIFGELLAKIIVVKVKRILKLSQFWSGL